MSPQRCETNGVLGGSGPCSWLLWPKANLLTKCILRIRPVRRSSPTEATACSCAPPVSDSARAELSDFPSKRIRIRNEYSYSDSDSYSVLVLGTEPPPETEQHLVLAT
ncbi:uncharacterized protein LOC110183508 [Drosophila serrata]|uniref:uncharacterized protein LOC110183508 n=1 Tax=Drosophila serrata TaxID=7274 RepID=UPI000A1CF73A|nr:uncharacterized protein LOC110183508 [Drosophila serrata]